MFVDVHCHIEELPRVERVVENARIDNVLIVNNGLNQKSNANNLRLKEENVLICMGLYPLEGLELNDLEVEGVIDFIRKNSLNIIGIGEVGIDMKWSDEFERQKNIFEKFLDLSLELDKPVIVHSRDAEERVFDILESKDVKKVVLHCFFGSDELIRRGIKNGWFFSIPTNVVFNESLQKNVDLIPIENLLCETDSPYLHPIQGEKNNEPCNVLESYNKISEIKKLSLVDVEKIIENNFRKLFNLEI